MSRITSSINKIKNNISNMSLASKSAMALVFAKFFQKGLSLISGPIFTRIMPQTEYGVTSTFNSWQNVLVIIATLNMASGVFNNGMVDFKDDRDSYKFSSLCLANLCTIILGVVFLIWHDFFSSLLDMSDILIVTMFLYFLVTPAYNYWLGTQRFDYKYKAMTAVIICSSIFSTVLSIIFVLISNDEFKATAKILTTEGVSILLGCFFAIYLLIKSKAKVKIKYWKYALTIQLPLIPHYLSMYVLSSSDRIMISKMCGTSDTAIYNVAYTVASIMLIFWNAVDSSYAPWIYQNLAQGRQDKIKKRGNEILMLFAGMTIISTLFAPEIIMILAPKSYYSGIYVIPSVSAGVFFTAVFSLYMRVELYYKNTKFTMFATILAAALNLILNYLLIPVFGFYAAGYTTMFSYMVLAVAHWLNLRRMGVSNTYNNRFILALSLLIILSTIALSFVYSSRLIRYLLIVVILIIVVRMKDKILAILKKN